MLFKIRDCFIDDKNLIKRFIFNYLYLYLIILIYQLFKNALLLTLKLNILGIYCF